MTNYIGARAVSFHSSPPSFLTRHSSFESVRLQESQVKTAQDHCDREKHERQNGRIPKVVKAKGRFVDIQAHSFGGEAGASLGQDEDLVEDAEQIHGPQ